MSDKAWPRMRRTGSERRVFCSIDVLLQGYGGVFRGTVTGFFLAGRLVPRGSGPGDVRRAPYATAPVWSAQAERDELFGKVKYYPKTNEVVEQGSSSDQFLFDVSLSRSSGSSLSRSSAELDRRPRPGHWCQEAVSGFALVSSLSSGLGALAQAIFFCAMFDGWIICSSWRG